MAGALLALLIVPVSWAQDDASLAYYRQAKINWRQAAGQSLTVGLNKHPFTESLLPLIPEFERLTGIKVEYLISRSRSTSPSSWRTCRSSGASSPSS